MVFLSASKVMVGDKTKKTTRRQQQQDVFTETRGPLASTKEHQNIYTDLETPNKNDNELVCLYLLYVLLFLHALLLGPNSEG